MLTKRDAKIKFAALIMTYGLMWTATVPKCAWDELAEINKVLTEADRRAAAKGDI